MAEAATIIALGTFGAQTAKVVLKLVQLRPFIKKCHTDVLALIDETEHLQSILTVRKREQDQFAGISVPDTIWSMCEDRCERAAQKLDRTATELLGKINRQKFGGSLAVYLARDTILKLQTSLQSARQDIILADYAFTRTLQYNLIEHVRRSERISEELLFRITQGAVNSLNDTNSVTTSTADIDYFVFTGVQRGGKLKMLQIEVHDLEDGEFFKILRIQHNRIRGFMLSCFSVWIFTHFDFYLFQKLGRSEYCRVRKAILPSGISGYRKRSRPYLGLDEITHLLRGLIDAQGQYAIESLPQRNRPLREDFHELETFWGLSATYSVSAYRILLYIIVGWVSSSLLCIATMKDIWACISLCLISWTVVPIMVLWTVHLSCNE
ncbi:uncharacterized protein PV07_01790 [Cladophialophora immunda]|uniref:Fungal N-terminal domain-containing protein n=1 Tax=Cladophialophora immunda TaxID=569365 RepID=A0A0D2CYT5_9EURO|nr:uncharacterized protein PV07_01790 [Cladophialophora immunda]KIW35070.1 hypothetical protein PV07_01790 [Cladophialophora immunda]